MFRKVSTTISQPTENHSRGLLGASGHLVAETQAPQHSFISRDAKFKGDLLSSGDVTIEGTLDGTIECRALTLRAQPSISGSIKAETVHVCGVFEGDLHAGKVVLTKTAEMTGNVFQEILEIHSGASFEGQVYRLDHASAIQPTEQSNKRTDGPAPNGTSPVRPPAS